MLHKNVSLIIFLSFRYGGANPEVNQVHFLKCSDGTKVRRCLLRDINASCVELHEERRNQHIFFP